MSLRVQILAGDRPYCCPIDGQQLQQTSLEDFEVNHTLLQIFELEGRDVIGDFETQAGQITYDATHKSRLGSGSSGSVYRGALL